MRLSPIVSRRPLFPTREATVLQLPFRCGVSARHRVGDRRCVSLLLGPTALFIFAHLQNICVPTGYAATLLAEKRARRFAAARFLLKSVG